MFFYALDLIFWIIISFYMVLNSFSWKYYACLYCFEVLKIGLTEHTHLVKTMQNTHLITLKLNLLLLVHVSGD